MNSKRILDCQDLVCAGLVLVLGVLILVGEIPINKALGLVSVPVGFALCVYELVRHGREDSLVPVPVEVPHNAKITNWKK